MKSILQNVNKQIENEMKMEEEQTKKVLISKSRLMTVKHKVYYKLECKTIEIEYQKSANNFIYQVFEEFGISKKIQQNSRLRLYNKIKNEMMEVIDNNDKRLYKIVCHTQYGCII